MKHLRLAALVLSAVLCVAGIGSFFMAAGTLLQANDALEGAENIRASQLRLVEAQKALGGSNLEEALTGAEAANAAAEDVRTTTEKIIPLLRAAERGSGSVTSVSRETGRRVASLEIRAALATKLLRALAGEQDSSAEAGVITNGFLRRVLRALKETNQSFPPT
jgi:hypothetical protein